MRARAPRIALAIASAAVGIAAAGVAGFFVLAQGSGPAPAGSLELAGLAEPVRIERDRVGVPHIRAARERDAFAGLGFAHAQDRLWQMELLRRAARGRLAELFGSGALPHDRLVRTLGLGRAAEAEEERLAPAPAALLAAYAAGVNGWIDAVRAGRGPLPFELRWLGADIEPWEPSDTLAIVRLRAWLLSRSLGASLLFEHLVREHGGVDSQDLMPVAPMDTHPRVLEELAHLGGVADGLADALALRGPVGSLAFAVGSVRSASGLPLLAGDVHAGFELPSPFYMAHLAAPDLELAGATWPGVPVFWMGGSRAAAWSQVALHASVSDLFDETLHPSDPHRYERGGRWVRAEVRAEEIRVRYRAAQAIEIVTTRHGPLLGTALPDRPRVRSFALGWAGAAPRSGIDALLRLQRATSWEAFRDALRRYPAPAAAFLFAGADGTIGRQVAGRLPLRTIETRFVPVPGGSRTYDWNGFIEFDDLPSRSGPLPWLVAETGPDGARWRHPVAWLWTNGGGAQRVRARLRSGARLGIEDVLAIQRERRSARARDTVRTLLDGVVPATERARRLHETLLAWDGRTDTTSLGASVYHAFRHRLGARLLEARLGARSELVALVRRAEPVPGLALDTLIERAAPRESRAAVAAALDETWSWLGVHVSSNPKRWTWGELHQLRLEHAFERLGSGLTYWAGRLLSRGPYPVPGDAESVWTMHHHELPTTRIAVGPVARYAVDLADPQHAEFGLAGGQSGHPGTPHYDDAFEAWRRGRPLPLWMHDRDLLYNSVGRWELHPARAEPYS